MTWNYRRRRGLWNRNIYSDDFMITKKVTTLAEQIEKYGMAIAFVPILPTILIMDVMNWFTDFTVVA